MPMAFDLFCNIIDVSWMSVRPFIYKKNQSRSTPTYEKTAQLLGAPPPDPLLGYSPPNFNFWRRHWLHLVNVVGLLGLT